MKDFVRAAAVGKPSMMSQPMSIIARSLKGVWCAVFGGDRTRAGPPDVIFHDPAADKAQNLDNPFIDPKAQRRIGEFIGDQSKRAKGSET